MADAIIANDSRNFWREARKICPKKNTSNTIDGVKEAKNIWELFADKYNGLYHSVPNDMDAMNRIKECVQQRLYNNVMKWLLMT